MFILSVASFLLFVADATVDVAVNTTVDDSVVLPCNLLIPTPIDLEYLRFYWQDEQNKVLYSFNKGKEKPEHVNESYRGRITAFPPDMITGNISVKLENTTLEDNKKVFQVFAAVLDSGGKRSFILGHRLICQITLHVAVPYENVSLAVEEKTMTAVCTTLRGYPQPSVTWSLQLLSNNSQHVVDQRDVHTTSPQDPHSLLYSVRSNINVSFGQYQSVTCLVHNPTLNVTLIRTHVFDKGEAVGSLLGWHVALIVAAVLSLCCCACIAYKMYLTFRQNRQAPPPPPNL